MKFTKKILGISMILLSALIILFNPGMLIVMFDAIYFVLYVFMDELVERTDGIMKHAMNKPFDIIYLFIGLIILFFGVDLIVEEEEEVS